jgi:nicotinamide-nucleotide amidase
MPLNLSNTLKKLSLKLVTAESCTGGLISTLITEIAGSSAIFERGYVTYSNEAKIECLGVPNSIIDQHGAVSEQTARAMAEGALKHSHANVAISVTGIAGPTGGTDEKPVGLVYFGFAIQGQPTVTKKKIFTGNREQIRTAAASYAITTLNALLTV